MRILDDIHALAVAATKATDLLDRYLQLRLREQGQPPAVAASISATPAPLAPPAAYDPDLIMALDAATMRYIEKRGEWPTQQQKADFLTKGVDFSEEYL